MASASLFWACSAGHASPSMAKHFWWTSSHLPWLGMTSCWGHNGSRRWAQSERISTPSPCHSSVTITYLPSSPPSSPGHMHGLPPAHSPDHDISLVPGSQPIDMWPYRDPGIDLQGWVGAPVCRHARMQMYWSIDF